MTGKPTHVSVTDDSSTPARSLDPCTDLGSLGDEMERLFDCFEPRFWIDRGLPDSDLSFPLCPAGDLAETGNASALSAELPGLEPDAIHVKINNGILTISGGKSEEKKEKDESHHLSERRRGSFQRSIRVPVNVEQDRIEARIANGVVKICLPKSKAAPAAEQTLAVKAA